MSLFGNLTTQGLEETEDRVGGYSPFDTDIYPATIKAAYAGQSSGGAQSVTIEADVNGRTYSETLWVTNKKGENFFLNKSDKTKKVQLPGFVVANELCLVTCEKELSEMTGEDKVINVYDYEQKKQVPKSVPMIMELIGKQVLLGIVRQLENKNEKQGDEYVPTADTREINFIDKVFHSPSKITVPEARGGQAEPKFYDAWIERNKGQTRDKRTIKDGEGGTSGRPGGRPASAPAAGAAAPAKKSLFGN